MNTPIPLSARIDLFYKLGERLSSISKEELSQLAMAAGSENNWFTMESVEKSIKAIAKMLSKPHLEAWIKPYSIAPNTSSNVGIIMAGNIPMVGFHDLMSVIISGHLAKVKLSSQDSVLMKFIIDELLKIESDVAAQIEIVDQLKGMDAVIATGSDNSARYFRHYFGKIPHVIRQNRTSVGVLNGKESQEDIVRLGGDIFQYYGLGCRNISKIFVPNGYDFKGFLDALHPYEETLHHHKYRNNYDYNKSIYLVNKEDHLDTGFLLLKESQEIVSPISVLFYEVYQSLAELDLKLSASRGKIQATISKDSWYEGSIPLGTAQCPMPWDYADGVDILEFLVELS